MERRDIEIFLTLAEELHFARTAERLGVSGARISQTIKHLERRFGVALFHRTSRQVAITPVGQAGRSGSRLPAHSGRHRQGDGRRVRPDTCWRGSFRRMRPAGGPSGAHRP
ncbi:helix-turn-helix domain-containing protein [Nocardia cyriacigeorgica]|uniref:helix-turn-helix domain-containing protein n=1 Tax=Nocardia cyriacigeorgica TaxID=135487 RepID=UPI0024571301|nr:LysR family transcriptional regulator [Nocardia cyriacigeorgica]